MSLQQILMKIAKDMMFNEFELISYFVYLDKLGWTHQYIEMEKYLLAISIIVKVIKKLIILA